MRHRRPGRRPGSAVASLTGRGGSGCIAAERRRIRPGSRDGAGHDGGVTPGGGGEESRRAAAGTSSCSASIACGGVRFLKVLWRRSAIFKTTFYIDCGGVVFGTSLWAPVAAQRGEACSSTGFAGAPCFFIAISLPSIAKEVFAFLYVHLFVTRAKPPLGQHPSTGKLCRKQPGTVTSHLTMWTFLGIASFIYVYKKCGDLMTYANKEVLLSVLVFFSLGLLLSYRYHFRGPKQQQQQRKTQLGMLSDVLSALPLVGFFWAKPTPGSQQVEQPKSRKVGSIQTWHVGCSVFLLFPLAADPLPW